jgi:AmiR/NasT family two-component response regulator
METPELDGAAADLVGQLNEKVEGLEEALLSRDVIGQAKGILMERLHLTSDQAFEELRAVSQQHNRKVRDISAALADTGEWPPAVLNGHRPAGRKINDGQSAKSA